jgi:hypothetical protein
MIVRKWALILRYASILAAVNLVGCAQDQAQQQQQYQQQQVAQEQKEEAKVITTIDDAKCRSYGAALGSPKYAQCRMFIDSQRVYSNAALTFPVLTQTQTPPQR